MTKLVTDHSMVEANWSDQITLPMDGNAEILELPSGSTICTQGFPWSAAQHESSYGMFTIKHLSYNIHNMALEASP